MKHPLLIFVLLVLQAVAVLADDDFAPVVPTLHSYGDTITLREPIVVPAGETFSGRLPNGKWTRYRAHRSMGDGSQDESQQPLFILEPGSCLEEIVIDKSAADGIHVNSADDRVTIIRMVEFRDVGEDAITILSGDTDGSVEIERCYFRNAADKVIQINSSARVFIRNCYAEDFARFCRTIGDGPDLPFRVEIQGLFAQRGQTILKMTNRRAEGTIRHCYLRDVDDVATAENGASISVQDIVRRR